MSETQILESKIQRNIIKYLKTRNGFTYKHFPDPPGMPDVCHFERGRVFLFEVKRSKKHKPEPLQLLRHKMLRKVGCVVHVVWSVEQVKKVMEDEFDD